MNCLLHAQLALVELSVETLSVGLCRPDCGALHGMKICCSSYDVLIFESAVATRVYSAFLPELAISNLLSLALWPPPTSFLILQSMKNTKKIGIVLVLSLAFFCAEIAGE
jgi:hypothetical protein